MIDISRPLSPATAVARGHALHTGLDAAPVSRGRVLRLAPGDEPSRGIAHRRAAHYGEAGFTAEPLDLERPIGPVQVIDARGVRSLTLDVFEAREAAGAHRLLVRTLDGLDPGRLWPTFSGRGPHPPRAPACGDGPAGWARDPGSGRRPATEREDRAGQT